jgi:GNAT superfamily N-acetyltransferase
MTEVTFVPASLDRLDDVLEVIPSGRGCTCQYFRMSSGDYSRSDEETRVGALRRQLEGTPAPGMVAYAGEFPVAWCGFGPRTDLERLVRSRTIPKVDDRAVWSIVCFNVRTGYRRQGITKGLLAAVVDYAREMGAPALEAYPIDPENSRVSTAFLYVGTVRTFEEAGFHRVAQTGSVSAGLPRWLMRLEVS